MDPIEVSPNQQLFGGKGIQSWAGGRLIDSRDALLVAEMTAVQPMIEEYLLSRAAEGYARMLSGKAESRLVLSM